MRQANRDDAWRWSLRTQRTHRGDRGGGASTAQWRFTAVAAVLLGGAAGAPAEGPLDRCSVIVTGTDERERGNGIQICLHRVLARVAADPSLTEDEAADRAAPQPMRLVEDIAYFDRMGGEPFHDEQGTRDRPYDLVVHFVPSGIDAALRALGRRPWRENRPALVFSVDVRERNGLAYALAVDGEHGEQQRAALYGAGERFGMRVVMATEAERHADAAPIPADFARRIRSVPLIAVTGRLVWSEQDAGWTGEWTIPDRNVSWSVRGVSYDEAFRDAVGGAAHRLAP